MHINSFNHFRAIAVLFIVAGHSFFVAELELNSLPEKVVENIIGGGTSLFVFISGVLFHHIFYKKFTYKRFASSKFKSLLTPYLICAAPFVYGHVVLGLKVHDDFFLPSGAGVTDELIIPTLKYYVTGGVSGPFWYIPFILVTFLLSPLHVYFIKIRPPCQLAIIFAFTIVSMLIHRPHGSIGLFQSVLYFTPVYFIGIMCSINRTQLYNALSGKEVYLLSAVIFFAIIEALTGVTSSFNQPIFEFKGIDVAIIQKIFMSIFFMVWLNRFESYNNHIVHTVASTSFSIFFVHIYVLHALLNLKPNPSSAWSDSWLLYLFIVPLTVTICILIAKTTRKIIPNHSKYLIGY